MPKKMVVSNFNAIDDNKSLTYDIKTMSKVFKDFFSNLAKSFLDKIPDPSNKYNLESVFLSVFFSIGTYSFLTTGSKL